MSIAKNTSTDQYCHLALKPHVNASHGTVKFVVIVVKKMELGGPLSVRVIKDMASLMRVSRLIIIQRLKI